MVVEVAYVGREVIGQVGHLLWPQRPRHRRGQDDAGIGEGERDTPSKVAAARFEVGGILHWRTLAGERVGARARKLRAVSRRDVIRSSGLGSVL